MRLTKANTAVIFLILANIIWGGGPPIFKWAFENVHTFTLAFLRYFIPVVIMIIIFPTYLAVKKEDLFRIILAGIFGITFNIGFYFVAIHYTASINASIIACAGPAFLILLSMLFLKERPGRKMLLGNVVGLTGVLLIVLEPGSAVAVKSSLFGNFLLILSTLAAVINTIIVKEIVKKYHAITLTFWTFVIGSITFYPLFLRESMQYGLLTHLNFQGFFGIFYGAIFCSLTAWLLFLWALERVHASDVTIFEYIAPVVTILIAIPLVHEFPNIFFILGSILVVIGMYIAENHKSHPHARHMMKK